MEDVLMKIHFLGTGAADWKQEEANTSQDFRRFSSILIDEVLLIDPGPCIPEFMQTFHCPALLDNCKHILVTHSHKDHYCQATIEALPQATLQSMETGDIWESEQHIVYAYAAHHGTTTDAVHYVIESKIDGKKLFYGCDGAWLYYETAMALQKHKLDLMIFDCTIGDIAGDYRIFEHNNIPMVVQMKETFRSRKCCNRFMVSHMARTLHPITHQETAEVLAQYNIETAYDNMVIAL